MEIKRIVINMLYADLLDRRPSILVEARLMGKTFLLRKIEQRARRQPENNLIRSYPIEAKSGNCGGEIPRGITAFLKRYPKTRSAYVLHNGKDIDLKAGDSVVHFRAWQDASRLPDEME